MRNHSVLVTILTLGLRFTRAWNHVSQTSLQEALESSAYVYVAFIWPSQDESKALEKEWVGLQDQEKDVNIVSLDCSANLKFCKDLDVESYPAIRVYHRDGRMDRFRGERRTRHLAMFLPRVLAPQPLEIDVDKDNLGALSRLDDVVLIAHPRPDDWDFWDRFKALAKRYKDRYRFIMSVSGTKRSSLVCYNNMDDQKHEASEVATVDALDKFVKLCSEPLIPELTRKNEPEYTNSQKSIIHYFASTEADKEAFRKEMRPLAKKFVDFLHFTVTDVNDYPDMPAVLGLKPGSKKGIVLENTNTGDKFHYKKSLSKLPTVGQVEKFLDDVIDGKVKAWADPAAKERAHEEL